MQRADITSIWETEKLPTERRRILEDNLCAATTAEDILAMFASPAITVQLIKLCCYYEARQDWSPLEIWQAVTLTGEATRLVHDHNIHHLAGPYLNKVMAAMKHRAA